MSIQRNPFVGLRPFESDESLLFFGRQQQTVELLEQLHKHHFVAIVGSSGSGKSSLIRAGLIPSLKAGYLIQERDSWMMAVMKPGQTPLYNLAEAIVNELNTSATEADVQALVQQVKEDGADALIAVLHPLWTVQNKNIFILVDQFEELFRFSGEANAAARRDDAIHFVNSLLTLASQPELPIYIVITLRSDFIGECSRFYGLPEAMNESQYLVPRLNRTQLKSVITGPVAIAGATISNSLLNRLLNDVGDNQDQLPILQHALMRTFDVWKESAADKPVDNEEYLQIGTMKHALSQHAEEAFAELSDEEKMVCEKMFKALTDKRTGAKGVRRPQTFSDLQLITGATAAALSNVINVFRKSGRAFIMPPEKIYLTPATVIDISHESLMRIWDRLQTWVDRESESKQIYMRLSDAAEQHAGGNAGLWRNPELQIALLWKEQNAPNPAWAAQVNSNFEQAIRFLEQSRLQEEQERLEKELLQKRRLIRARKIAAAFIVLFLAALGVMVYAFTLKGEATAQKNEAIKQQRVALKQKIIADKNARRADSLNRKTDEALETAKLSEQDALKAKDTAEQERQKALSFAQNAINASKEAKLNLDAANQARSDAELQKQDADQAKKQAIDNSRSAELNQRRTDTLKNRAESRNLAIQAIAQMNEKKWQDSKTNALKAYEENLQNSGPTQDVNIFKALYVNWNAATNNKNQFNEHKYPVHCITGTGNKIVTADESGKIYISTIQNNTLKPLGSYNTKSEIRALSLSPDGSQLAAFAVRGAGFLFTVSPDGTIKETNTKLPFTGICKSAAFYNNNQLLLLTTTGISRYDSKNTSADFYPNDGVEAMRVINSHIYLSGKKNITVYNSWNDIKSNIGKVVLQLNGNNTICSMAIDASEQYIAAGTYGGNIAVARIGQSATPPTPKLHQSSVNDLRFANVSGNRLQLASAGADKTIRLIDVESFLKKVNTEEIVVLEGHSKWVYQLFYKNDGQLLFSCGEDNKVMIWQPTMADLYKTLQ